MTSSESIYPDIHPFIYLYIPANDTEPLKEILFEGHSEKELRNTLQNKFRSNLLSRDQQSEMAKHIQKKIKANSQNQSIAEKEQSNESKTGERESAEGVNTLPASLQSDLLDKYLNESSFEIVPITMPTSKTKYIGVSLYVDDSGLFKELNTNSRASALAQRKICGDAFLLANHDDPALENWERVDCTLEMYETLKNQPSKAKYNVDDKVQMNQTTLTREMESKRVNTDDIERAYNAKNQGNIEVEKQNWNEAEKLYSKTIELTEGRIDLLPTYSEILQLRLAAFLNRALCNLKLKKWNAALKDATGALEIDHQNIKAYYRLALACEEIHEYQQALDAIKQFEFYGGSSKDANLIRKNIKAKEQEYKQIQKEKFSNLFSKYSK